MVVEVREAHALVRVEEVLAHAALHARAHHVTPEDHEVATDEAQCVHAHEPHGKIGERAHDGIRALGKEAARERAQDLREGEVDRRHRHGSDDVDDKQVPLSTVVREERAEEGAVLGGHGTSLAVGANRA